ncbi:MFS general substrate transporter [Pseudohyphozyma bogoriensis]|nr:MFS general substrate transporter [Pseudohyphozyma bogoriensis]
MQTILQFRRFKHDPSVRALVSTPPSDDPEASAATLTDRKADAFLVQFESGDPADPHNWSKAKRWAITLTVGVVSSGVGIAGGINSAAAHDAMRELRVSEEVISLDTALFLLGLGLSSVFLAPLSEIGGRNPVYIITLALFMLFEIGCALSPNIGSRLVLRFLAGLAGSTPLSNAGGSLSDLWSTTERTAAFVIFSVCGLVGPMLGPVMGGYVGDSYLGYRWCDWITVIFTATMLVVCTFFLPETLAPVLLKFKAQQIRKLTGDERYETALERLRHTVPFKEHFIEGLQRPFAMLALEPIVVFFSLYMSVVYIVLFGNLVAFPKVYEQYGLSDGKIGLTFLPVAIGVVCVGFMTPLITRSHMRELEKVKARGGERLEPEERLQLAMVGTWCIPVSLFWMAWTCYPSVPIWAPLASQIFFGIGMLSCFISSYQYIIDSYLATAASALSCLTIVRYPISGGAVLFTGPMFDRLGPHWALTLLAFISLAACPIPFVFYKWGPRIRSWSKYTAKIEAKHEAMAK